MSAEAAAWLANVRAEAEAHGTLCVIVRGYGRTVALFPEDIVGKTDDELQAFIDARLAQR